MGECIEISAGDDQDVDYFETLSNYISDLYNGYLVEKEDLMSKYRHNERDLQEIDEKKLLLSKQIEYNENVFIPGKNHDQEQYELYVLNEKKEQLVRRNEVLQEIIDQLDQRIYNVEKLLKKVKIDSYKEYMENCKESERFKIEILRSQEMERKRIARELHDTVIQNLTNLVHKSELALKVIDMDPIRAKLELVTISKNIKDIIGEMRGIIYNLRPMAFDDMGIDIIIERELSKFKKDGIDVEYIVEGEGHNTDQIVLLTLIRIIQEACNNAYKHARPTKLEVKLLYDNDFIQLFIKDNGTGFYYNGEKELDYELKSGFGLSMMKERVYLLSGNLTVNSDKDNGTEIYVKVPKNYTEDN